MHATEHKTKIDLIHGPIGHNLFTFALPIMLGAFVTQLYNVADSVIVGRFINADALAAVSAASPVMNIILLFMVGLSSGSTVAVAQKIGLNDTQRLQQTVSTIASLTLVCGVFISVLGVFASKPLLILLKTPDTIIQDAWIYLIIIYLGAVGNMCYQMGNGTLQGMGDSTWPFLFLVVCSVLNVILDLLTVVVLHWGVAGVALSTSFSQLVSGVGVIYRINHGNYGVRLSRGTIKIYKREARNIISVGLPAAIQNIGNSIAALCVQSSVNYFGTAFIAANSIVMRVDDLLAIPAMSVGTALCTFVGQNMGVLQTERSRKGVNGCITVLTATGGGLCLILILLRNVFPLLFTSDQNVLTYAADGLLIMSFQCLVIGVDRCLVNTMRGIGKSVVPMITAQFGAFSRIPLAYFLGVCRNDYKGIFYAMLIAAIIRATAITVYYSFGGWEKAVRQFKKREHAR